MRQITYTQAIHEGLDQALEQDKNVICYGLGTDDPKGVFGTTLDLHKKHGSERVFDMPTSENAMTGIAIGASLNGIRPVMCHQRLDFFLLAMDQLVNNAAKWSYMFGGQSAVPITIRLIIGRGWGQGPTHSQNLQSWFAHIPGLKVVIPTNPYDAKGMLLEAIFDDNPVVFLEHRWLHNMQGNVPQEAYRLPLNKAQLLREGNDATIVSLSYMTVEALHATDALEKEGISCDLIDLRTVNPIDWESIETSLKKTGRLLVVDTASQTCSVASEIVAHCSIHFFDSLKKAPQRLALPDIPTPTSSYLTKEYYFGAQEIAQEVLKLVDQKSEIALCKQGAHDTPGDWFKGPF